MLKNHPHRGADLDGPHAAAVVEGTSVQPAFANQLLGHSQQLSIMPSAQIEGGTGISFDILLEVKLSSLPIGQMLTGPKANAGAAGTLPWF
jgi:hypothetical protein